MRSLSFIVLGVLVRCVPAIAAGTFEVEIHTGLPARGSWASYLRDAQHDVTAATEGRVSLRYVTTPVLSDDPSGRALSLPGLVSNAVAYAVAVSNVAPSVVSALSSRGWTVYGVEPLALAYAFSTKRIEGTNDLLGAAVWSPGTNGVERTLAAFGFRRVKRGELMDVAGMIAEGDVEAIIAPPLGVVLARWHRQLSFLMELPLMGVCTVLAARSADLEEISGADRTVTDDILSRALPRMAAEFRARNADALTVLRARSDVMSIVSPTPAQRAGWDAWALDVRRRAVAQGLVDAGLAERLELMCGGKKEP